MPPFSASTTPSSLAAIHPAQRSRSSQPISRSSITRRNQRGAYDPRPDSAVLGGEDLSRVMAPAYLTRNHESTQSPASSIPSSKSIPYSISSPIGPPFYPTPEQYGGYGFNNNKQLLLPWRLSARMPSEISTHQPHWLSSVRSCLRLLIIVLSGAVAVLLVHTLEIYRGNISLDLRKGELPMTWPARTNLAPTLILFAIAAANFLASVAILTMSFKRSFRRPIRSRDAYRIVAGSFGVILWATALVVFNLLDKASKASLGRYACMNKNIMSNGRYQYRAVCSEQVS